MKLIKELINKKIELYSDFQNRRHYLISAWNLHIAYLICLNLTGYKDLKIKKKNKMFSKLFNKINLGDYESAEKLLNKINYFVKDELKIINQALYSMETNKDLINELGDINPERYRNYGFVAVSVFDSP